GLETGQLQGRPYFVMEHLDGETLEELLERRPRLPPAEAVRIAYQTLIGLHHLHEHGLVHGDIQPANLLLVPATPAGKPDAGLSATVKILETGLGRAGEAGASPEHAAGQLARTGAVPGRAATITPEA